MGSRGGARSYSPQTGHPVSETQTSPPMGTTHKVSTQTKLYGAVKPYAAQLLAGRILALDPSVGSWSSQPGYAIFEAGQLIDSGVIEMPVGATRSRRLYYLRRILTDQFTEKFDAVVIEDIPTSRVNRRRGGGVYFDAKAQVPLHKAVGVIESCFDAHTLFVHPATWRTYATEEHLSMKTRGEPTDERDAVVMGQTVLLLAAHAAAHPDKKRKGKKK